jgi:phosphomannomutase
VFTGDQIGTLFAAWVLQGYKNSGEPAGWSLFWSTRIDLVAEELLSDLTDRLAMVASTVSSKMIASMARLEGFKFEDSLTGERAQLFPSSSI